MVIRFAFLGRLVVPRQAVEHRQDDCDNDREHWVWVSKFQSQDLIGVLDLMLFPGTCKMIIGQADEVHCRFEVAFALNQKRDISGFRRPTMGSRFAFGQRVFLRLFGQSNIAVSVPVDVHEHSPFDKEGIFVDARLRPFGHPGQSENAFT